MRKWVPASYAWCESYSLILYTTRKMDFANRRKNIYILALEYNLKKCYTYIKVSACTFDRLIFAH